jgi:hypothetical protein
VNSPNGLMDGGDYQRWVVQGLEKLRSSRFGFVVTTDASADRCATFFGGKFDLLVLFTHSRPDGWLEFSEGMVHQNTLLSYLPSDARFIWDLVACPIVDFGDAVQLRAPHVEVISSDLELTPNVWLEYYSVMFAMIAEYSATYEQAKIASDAYAYKMARNLHGSATA